MIDLKISAGKIPIAVLCSTGIVGTVSAMVPSRSRSKSTPLCVARHQKDLQKSQDPTFPLLCNLIGEA